jgi:hypothetical protein
MATTAAAAHDRPREIHNTCIDEQLARAERCGMTHLPTGRRCTLPAHHPSGCAFQPADRSRPPAEPRSALEQQRLVLDAATASMQMHGVSPTQAEVDAARELAAGRLDFAGYRRRVGV